jgi:hypothetical protein
MCSVRGGDDEVWRAEGDDVVVMEDVWWGNLATTPARDSARMSRGRDSG